MGILTHSEEKVFVCGKLKPVSLLKFVPMDKLLDEMFVCAIDKTIFENMLTVSPVDENFAFNIQTIRKYPFKDILDGHFFMAKYSAWHAHSRLPFCRLENSNEDDKKNESDCSLGSIYDLDIA